MLLPRLQVDVGHRELEKAPEILYGVVQALVGAEEKRLLECARDGSDRPEHPRLAAALRR